MSKNLIEELTKDYNEHFSKMLDHDYKMVYKIINIFEEYWTTPTDKLDYKLEIKDNNLYIQDTLIGKLNE